jgi:diguanylate cyclase (GGDEF)-like protein
MSSPLIDRVLSCPTLPTLPSVAVRVLELTRDPKVSINAMAQTVQGDPALSVKVLKTVNSSYYALSTPCPSISRAMSMLGLNTVKAIVLGFSLVDSTRAAGIDDRFDMASYWRRAVHCAAAARALAIRTATCDPEEAFIAALVLDIGMLACFAAIRDEYLKVLNLASPDHDQIGQVEKKVLGFDHPHIGRLLAERWRLPSQLIECIGTHHNPGDSHAQGDPLVRVVYLAGQAAGALIVRDNKRKLGEFIVKSREWFGIEQAESRELLIQTATGAAELSKALELKTGAPANVSAILSEAREALVVAQEAVQQETAQLRRNNDELSRKNITDGLTGAFNRSHFDSELKAAFDLAKDEGRPLTVIFIDADKFKSVNDTHGHQAGDAVLMELSKRVMTVVGQRGGVFRYGGEEFAVVLPRVGLGAGALFAEHLRKAVGDNPFDLRPHKVDLTLKITISLGVSAMEPACAKLIESPEQITHAADRGVYAAKAAGRNCVKTIDLGVPASAHAPEPASGGAEATPKDQGPREKRTVMIVEDDPLAARLMSFLFSKCKDLRPVVVKTGEEALEWMAFPSADRPRPDLIVSDLNLPGMSGIQLIQAVHQKDPENHTPFLIVTAAADEANQSASLAAGATGFIDKADFCTHTEHWLTTIGELIQDRRKAA